MAPSIPGSSFLFSPLTAKEHDMSRNAPFSSTLMRIARTKPRNPLVVAAAKRLAGAHGKTAGGRRQQAQRALRHELKSLHPSP
jgi:hypothetical protein